MTNLVDFGLEKSEYEKILAILAKYTAVDKAVIYGSRAKGCYRKGSDIDLTLFGKNLTYDTLLSISLDLDELLLPYCFDLSLYDEIKDDALKQHIARVGKIFYSY